MPVDVVHQIQAFNAGRDAERLSIKYQRMNGNFFAFFRGTCHLFYQRLPAARLKASPLVWICGDLHLENFGSYKGNNRLAYFDLNDFDEAALAPASWELVRMLTSLLVGGANLSISPLEAQTLCSVFLDEYASSLALGKAFWIESETAQGVVRELLVDLRDRRRAKFINARTTSTAQGRMLKLDGKKALPVSDSQRLAVTGFMNRFAKTQSQPEFFKVIDVARRIAGTGSLGVKRYVILVNGKGAPSGHYLLDLKQSLSSCVAPYFAALQPKWRSQAHRIVDIQRRSQAVSVALLAPVRFEGDAFVVRELQPAEDRITLEETPRTMSELKGVVGSMGQMVAWAQLRSAGREGSAIADDLIEFGLRKKWKKNLLVASQACAVQVQKDWATFTKAYARGAFNA